MDNLQLESFHTACQSIINEAHATRALNYAVGYAKAGLTLQSEDEVRVQCLYLLNNITHWRGPVAKATRQTLKELAK